MTSESGKNTGGPRGKTLGKGMGREREKTGQKGRRIRLQGNEKGGALLYPLVVGGLGRKGAGKVSSKKY